MVNKKNNSGFVLLMSIVLVIFLGILLTASSLRSSIELQESLNRLAIQQAFYAAESGLQWAVSYLGQTPGYRVTAGTTPTPLYINTTGSPPVAKGFYNVTIADAPNYNNFLQSVWVRVWGQDASRKVTVSIQARVVVESPAAFLISTPGDLHVGSGATLDHNILGNNVYFDVTSSQGQINVNGNVYYLQGVTGYYDANGKVDPDVNVSGGPPTQSPTESFSGVDTSYYQSQAQIGGLNCANAGQYCDANGDLTYNGDISKQNLNAPNGVVYAPGNIYISGTVQDSMVFVAGGNVYIEGSVTVPDSNGIPPQNNSSAPQVGLLAGQSVFIDANAPSSNMIVDALIIANGGPDSQGIPDPNGGILQALPVSGSNNPKADITIMGSMALRAAGARSAVDLSVYSTRNYQYNTQFQNNLHIPLLPASSQIVNWQEVNPNDPIPD